MVTTTERPRAIDRSRAATYTLAETAALFGISRSALYAMCRERRAPVEPIRLARKLLFPKSIVDAMLAIQEPAVR